MGKIKKEPVDDNEQEVTVKTEPMDDQVVVKEEELTYEDKLQFVNAISKPMASKKLSKKCYKLMKKAMKHKGYIRNGLKDVQKWIRKGEKGLVVFAGDVDPIDIMCHLPAVCEDQDIPYCYTPSRTDIGGALGVKRAIVAVLIKEHDEYKEAYEELKAELKTLAVEL